jgi:serine protease Do
MVLEPGETTVSNIYKKMSSAVVSINVTGEQTTFFNQIIESAGAGSGIIFKEDNDNVYIVTNYHVVTGSNEITISLDDDVQVNASPVGGSESDDIAVISVRKADMIAAKITEYSIAEFADSSNIEIGDVAVAIGNALGEGKSATLGIISAIDKQINIENQILAVIQTDAAINPGNSGGALVNSSGQVIGINTAKIDGGEGMGYAIPSNKVISIIDGIIGKGRVETPQLGIEGIPITEELKSAYNLPSLGVYINNVVANSSADEGGVRTGDIITGVNGKEITTFEELSGAIQASKVGDKMTLTVIRDGIETITVEVVLKNSEMKF